MKRALLASILLLAACGDDSVVTNRDAGSTDGPVDALVYRSHEAQYCSSNADDDPFYECAPPLVCVNTYDELVRGGGDGGPGFRPVPIYLCRVPCQPGGACASGEICCAGALTDGQTQHACVQQSRCEPLVRDR
jgi:hypothetical protein